MEERKPVDLSPRQIEEAQRIVREEWPDWMRRNRDAVHVQPIRNERERTTMNATEKFALERDAAERQALGLPPREFATAKERAEFARQLVEKEAARDAARRAGR